MPRAFPCQKQQLREPRITMYLNTVLQRRWAFELSLNWLLDRSRKIHHRIQNHHQPTICIVDLVIYHQRLCPNRCLFASHPTDCRTQNDWLSHDGILYRGDLGNRPSRQDCRQEQPYHHAFNSYHRLLLQFLSHFGNEHASILLDFHSSYFLRHYWHHLSDWMHLANRLLFLRWGEWRLSNI